MHIHLPSNRVLSQRLENFSFFTGLFVLCLAGVVLSSWIFHLSLLASFSANFLAITPLTAILCIVAIVSLFIGEKPQPIGKTAKTPGAFAVFISVACAAIVLAGGIGISFWAYAMGSALSVRGMSFILIGLALILPYTNILHRFHFVHSFSFTVMVIQSIPLLGFLYRLLSPGLSTHILYISTDEALLVFLLCHAILLRWPDRGFVGMFTIDTASSVFAFRLLIINFLLTPVVGIVSLLGARLFGYTSPETIAVFAVLLMGIGAVLSWFSISLLYRLELEHFLMKEELRVHNIDLKLGEEEMAAKAAALAETNKEYAKKLTYQDTYKDLAERLD